MTAAQHASLIGVSATAAITGTGAITINTASTSIAADASPTAYVLTGAGANTITVAAAGQNVTTAANASAQTIKTGTLTSYTGTVTGNATDTSTVLAIGANNTNISGAVLNIGAATGVDVLAQGTNAVTMTAAQHASLIGVSATNAITGSGAITLTTAATGAVALDDSVGTYVLAAGANSVTVGAIGQTINADALTDAQVLTLAGTQAVTVTLVGGDLTSTSSGNTTVTATTGTNVITTGAGADTITGGAGADTLKGGGGADVYKYTATADGSTTPGLGDTISTADFVSGSDKFNFTNTAFGSLGAGALTAASDTGFTVSQAATLIDLANLTADSEVYRATFNTTTFDAAFYNALDAAMTGGLGNHTGAAFFIITNGTDSRILYDADTNATAAGSIVELVKIVGAGTLTVATTDLVIV
jgi:Ca2+-binding RTX toxin-like protein